MKWKVDSGNFLQKRIKILNFLQKQFEILLETDCIYPLTFLESSFFIHSFNGRADQEFEFLAKADRYFVGDRLYLSVNFFEIKLFLSTPLTVERIKNLNFLQKQIEILLETGGIYLLTFLESSFFYALL